MNTFIPIAYKSKSFPHSPTMALFINTDTWKIGFAHYEEPASMTINADGTLQVYEK